MTILVKKPNGKLVYFGYVSDRELDSALCTLSIPDIHLSLIIDTRDILSIIRTNRIYTLPKLLKEKPNVKARKNHSSDISLSIQEFSGYEMKKHGVNSSYYKV